MKIGILTASRTDNNGTDLQALAMLNLFKRMGATNVELIDYECEKLESSKHLLNPLSLRRIVYYPISYYLHFKHVRFRNTFFLRSSIKYNKETLPDAKYDIIVVGSDQIWNLMITGGDTSFFLPFKNPGQRKYSYAASIGRENIDSWNEEYRLSEMLSDFQVVSVREESAVKTLSSIGINARYDLDPILMGSAEDWNLFLKKKNGQKYVLLYQLNDKSPAWDEAKRIALLKGWKVVNVSPVLKCYQGVNTIRCVGIGEWISFVANAEMVFTSSYHCLSFAILFNKFFCLVPSKNSVQNNARMLDLLDRLGLNRMVYSPSYDFSQPVDWDKVKGLIENLRNISAQYIKTIIEG